MFPLRHAARRLSTKPVLRLSPLPKTVVPNRYLTITQSVRAATTAAKHGDHASDHAQHDSHGHESHYDPPGGWLWGIRPGEKAEREGWEIPFYIMCAGYVVAVIAYTMKEDTS